MVQKATQQLLFEVDWSGGGSVPDGVDVLVIDMPPGTGDVALTLGQLVKVDGKLTMLCPRVFIVSNRRCHRVHRTGRRPCGCEEGRRDVSKNKRPGTLQARS